MVFRAGLLQDEADPAFGVSTAIPFADGGIVTFRTIVRVVWPVWVDGRLNGK